MWFQLRMSRTAGTKCRSQVTRSRSQVTENALKELDTLLGFSCLFICFISGYVAIRHMFGIDHASRCSKSKRTKWRKLHIALVGTWRVPSHVRMPGDLSSLHANELERLERRFSEENAFLTIDCTATWVADFYLWLHTLSGFQDSSSIMKPFKAWKRS